MADRSTVFGDQHVKNGGWRRTGAQTKFDSGNRSCPRIHEIQIGIWIWIEIWIWIKVWVWIEVLSLPRGFHPGPNQDTQSPLQSPQFSLVVGVYNVRRQC